MSTPDQAMAGIPKIATNAICTVAFLLEELEDTQINIAFKEAFNSQITELSSDMKLLIKDAKEKINDYIKLSENHSNRTPTQPSGLQGQNTMMYTSVVINPPAHTNPKLATKEGIKARQFLIKGIKESKLSHLDNLQLKSELEQNFFRIRPTLRKNLVCYQHKKWRHHNQIDNR